MLLTRTLTKYGKDSRGKFDYRHVERKNSPPIWVPGATKLSRYQIAKLRSEDGEFMTGHAIGEIGLASAFSAFPLVLGFLGAVLMAATDAVVADVIGICILSGATIFQALLLCFIGIFGESLYRLMRIKHARVDGIRVYTVNDLQLKLLSQALGDNWSKVMTTSTGSDFFAGQLNCVITRYMESSEQVQTVIAQQGKKLKPETRKQLSVRIEELANTAAADIDQLYQQRQADKELEAVKAKEAEAYEKAQATEVAETFARAALDATEHLVKKD